MAIEEPIQNKLNEENKATETQTQHEFAFT